MTGDAYFARYFGAMNAHQQRAVISRRLDVARGGGSTNERLTLIFLILEP